MPLTLNAIAQRLTALEVPFAGDVIHLSYRAAEAAKVNGAALSAEIEALANGSTLAPDATPEQKAASVHAFVAAQVAGLVESWDVAESVAEDGTPGPMVPLTPDSLERIDDGFLTAVFKAVVADVTQSK